jgi:hypothetical protein
LLTSLLDLPRPSGLARLHSSSVHQVPPAPDVRSPRLQC